MGDTEFLATDLLSAYLVVWGIAFILGTSVTQDVKPDHLYKHVGLVVIFIPGLLISFSISAWSICKNGVLAARGSKEKRE